MHSRQDSPSPSSQTRLSYSHPTQSMLDYQRYSVDPYSVATPSPPRDYESISPGVSAVRQKRKQVKNACSACQRACKRCDVGRPCERCVKYGMQDTCRDSQRKERKKGVKRGPYKKRDGMLNELQRMNMPIKTRTSRVSSISEPSQASTSASHMDPSAPVQLYIQSVPSARPSEGTFPYSTAVMIPAPTQHPSLASMHSSSPHTNIHHSTRAEDQYYQPRFDHLTHASTRPGHFRVDSYPAQEYQAKQVAQMVDQRSLRTLQYPSEQSPPRERQYPQSYENHRHNMIQASPAHHDVSYHPQSEPIHDSPRTIDAHYSYQGQQHQRSYERTYERTYDRSYQERSYQERSYANDTQMQEVHTQEVQPQYYSSYDYPQSSSYGSQSYGYPQSLASQSMTNPQSISASQSMPASQSMSNQHLPEQNEQAYMNRPPQDQVSYASSIDSYPTQQQSYPSQPMTDGVQYVMRSTARVVHREMVTHPHVGNVQIQSN